MAPRHRRYVAQLDTAAAEEDARLSVKHARFVISRAKYFRPGVPLDYDHLQDGFLGALIAEEKFDSERGVPFVAYAKHYIDKQILTGRYQHTELTSGYSDLLDTHQEVAAASVEPSDSESSAYSSELWAALGLLSELEQRVIRSRYGLDCPRLPVRALAEELGRAKSSVYDIERLALRRLSELLDGEQVTGEATRTA